MKDILIIFVGQAGINIAERFWRYAFETLQLPPMVPTNSNPNDIQDKKLNQEIDHVEQYTTYEIEEARRMFFYCPNEEKYVPRALFIDVESQPIRSFAEKYRTTFPKESFIYNMYGSASMFARAYRLGEDLKPLILDRITNMIKSSAIQNLEGIVLVHATGGGAGSGLFTSVCEILKQRFYKVPILALSIFPSSSISSNSIEAYNTIFALNSLLTYSDASIVFDNDKIIQLIREKYEVKTPSFEDINLILSRFFFSILMQFAMPGAVLRVDFNKIFTNLVPYKYMKFLMAGISPFRFDEFSMNKLSEIVEELTNGENYLVDCDMATGKFTSSLYMFIGKIGPEVQTELKKAKDKLEFMKWIPTGTMVGFTPKEKLTLDGKSLLRQGIVLSNHSSIVQLFKRILSQFEIMKSKSAFLHHFIRESIEAVEKMDKSYENVQRIVKFYEIAEKSGAKKEAIVEIAPEQS